MATFTVDDQDLDDLVRRDFWQCVRDQGRWPVGAFAAATVLSWVHLLLAATALGMGLAWAYSFIQVIRGIRPWYVSHHGSMGGPVTVEFTDEGVRTAMALGEGIIRWRELSAIRNYAGCFVLEDRGEEILILPKRHFTSNELILLQSQATALEKAAQSKAG